MGDRHRSGLRYLMGTPFVLALAHLAWPLLVASSLAAAQPSASINSASSTCYVELLPSAKADSGFSLSFAKHGNVILGSTADAEARDPDEHAPAPLARSVILGSCRIPSREINQVHRDGDRVGLNPATEPVTASEMRPGFNKLAPGSDDARTPLVVLDGHSEVGRIANPSYQDASLQGFSWPSVVLQIVGLLAALFVFSLLLCLGFILLMRRLAAGSDALFRVQFINQRGDQEAGYAPDVRKAKVLTRHKTERKRRSSSQQPAQMQDTANRPAPHRQEETRPKAEKKMLRQILKHNLQLREQIGELSAAQ